LPVLRAADRVVVDGKFFRAGESKFYIKGCTYGPFAPNADGDPFPPPVRAQADFDLLNDLGANTIRVYHLPPYWFLDKAHEAGLKVFLDIPWRKHTCFLDDTEATREARETVARVTRATLSHPAIFAFSLVNEIPADIARWYGHERIENFINDLVRIVKDIDPMRLCTFANYPPTEFLHPSEVDFYCFNVYLHQRRVFHNYLGRLQSLAGDKPLMLGEFGIDSIREGDDRKAGILSWHIETAFRNGLAGTMLFSFTDDWFTGGSQIEDWAFGLVDRERRPKRAFFAVQRQFQTAPYFPLSRTPRVSVVVASYNGGRTLRACLDSLLKLNYPDYEIILVDDGSTDDTEAIAARYPTVRTIRQKNFGLSVARNVGIQAASGEIVAFTDSDCRADEDWLYYLVSDLLGSGAAAIGGHNFPPPEDDWVAGCVAASPGAPAHVMLNDRIAEHIPGCNMAFLKSVLIEIGGFDPIFTKAGDDVDVCWRLQQLGHQITFSHSGFVWHYRRASVGAYLRQQRGYGEAEALLKRKHPEYFNSLGGSIWRGRIYSSSKHGVTLTRPIIYHGVFGSSLFQTIYTPEPTGLATFMTSLEWHVGVTLPLALLADIFTPLWPVPLFTLLASITVCAIAAAQAQVPRKHGRFWTRPLIALLYFMQPIARGFARHQGRFRRRGTPDHTLDALEAHANQANLPAVRMLAYWSEDQVERVSMLKKLFERLRRDGWLSRCDSGWSEWDVEILGGRWSKLLIQTVSENHGGNKRLIRVRLLDRWTLFAKTVFLAVLGVELVTVNLLGNYVGPLHVAPVLVTVGLLALYVHLRSRRLRRLVGALVDEVAAELRLTRLDPK
jgi:GT2 family glycosyltransferase